MIDQVLGQYHIKELLGEGGMATVYKALQPSMQRHVAIKVMSADLSQNVEFVGRFEQEAQIFAELQHPHILPVIDFGRTDNHLYIVMRLVEGGSLDLRIRHQPLALELALKLILQVGSALSFAHERGVVHRDLKPNNVLLDANNNAYLTDFGLAKMLRGASTLTRTDVFLGTPAYMAPEQWRGEAVDARTDVYAMGIMLYEMIIGDLPFSADTPHVLMYKHVNEPPISPRTRNDQVSPQIEDVLMTALSKAPDERYQSAVELASAFKVAVETQKMSSNTHGLAKAELVVEQSPVSTTVQEIQFRLLGTPEVYNEGERVRLYSAKVWALMTYLALHANKAQSREHLAALLWGETPDSNARASLRQALYSIKRVLGSTADLLLEIDQDSVTLRTVDAVGIDVIDLLAAYQQDDYSRVVDLYGGLLLEGVQIADCAEYESWLYLQRDSFEQKVITALQKLVTSLIDVGAHENAFPHAQRLTEMDVLNESGHRLLMRIYAAQGDLAAARRQYQLCADLLARELGVEPMPETTALYERLGQSSKIHATLIPQPLPQAEVVGDLPLVERVQELQVLGRAWDRVQQGEQDLIVISGEPGIGKSRLVQEFIRQRQIGHHLIGRCFEVESNTPFAMWADLFRALTQPIWRAQIANLEPVWLRQVARIVPALASGSDEDIETASNEEKRLRLLQGVVRCLMQIGSSPLLIVFEDLHWADEGSLELLHYAARQLTHSPILFVSTFQPNSPNRRLQQFVRSATNNTRAILLEPLAQTSVHGLVTNLPMAMSSELSQRLYQFSNGNPFVLTETLRVLSERYEQGEDISAQSALPVSDQLQQLVLDRLENISEAQRRILETAALISRPFDLRLLRSISGIAEVQLLEDLDILLARRFLRDVQTDKRIETMDIAHNYTRTIIADSLRLPRRMALHRRIAETLASLPHKNVSEIAFHYEQAGDERGIEFLVLAARQVEQLYSLSAAADFYQRALMLVQDNDVSQQFEICLALESVLDQAGNRALQSEVLDRLIDLAEQLDDPALLADIYVRRASYLTYTGKYDLSRQDLELALEQYQSVADLSGEANALRELGFLQWTLGHYGPALEFNREALQLHRREGNPQGQATALHNLAEIHRGLGSPHQAIDMYRQAEELHWSTRNRQGLTLTFYGIAHAYRSVDEVEQAAHYLTQARDQSAEVKNYLMQSRIYHALATLYWERDEPDAALEYLRKAVEVSRGIGYSLGIAHSLWLLSVYYGRLGVVDEAREHMNEAILWLKMAEDTTQLAVAQQWLTNLNEGRVDLLEPPRTTQWIRTHVKVAEGKIYCEFESPAARVRQGL